MKLSRIQSDSKKVILRERPDVVQIFDESNTMISKKIAHRLTVSGYLTKAGNPSCYSDLPKEITRELIDRIVDFCLAEPGDTRQHLLAEDIRHGRIDVRGSPMREALQLHRAEKAASKALLQLRPRHGCKQGIRLANDAYLRHKTRPSTTLRKAFSRSTSA